VIQLRVVSEGVEQHLNSVKQLESWGIHLLQIAYYHAVHNKQMLSINIFSFRTLFVSHGPHLRTTKKLDFVLENEFEHL